MTSPARILLVEDDPSLRHIVAELLEEEGFEVYCAANGEEALSQLSDSEVPSVILLDLAMPVMDGWTFRAAQRRDPRLARIPTVVVSASIEASPHAIGALAPAAFLAKPFDLDQLIRTVQRLC